jgi:Fe-S cluster assembly iron-binding protein IscA
MIKNYSELIIDKSSKEEIEGDEITEVNDMMTELLKIINTKTMH